MSGGSKSKKFAIFSGFDLKCRCQAEILLMSKYSIDLTILETNDLIGVESSAPTMVREAP